MCKTCGSPLTVNLNHVFNIECIPQITSDGLFVSNIDLERTVAGTVRMVASFHCSICGGEVKHSDILVECSGCFQYFKPEELVIFPKVVGGQYCRDDAKEYTSLGYEPTPVKDLLFTLTIKKEK